MSSDSNAALVAAYKLDLLTNYAVYAAAVIVLYEHFITLKYEVDYLRSRRKSAATWIFLSNRYLLIAQVLSSIAPISPRFCNSSPAVNSLEFLADTIVDVPLHAFTIMRSVALLPTRTWKLIATGILSALTLMLLATNTYRNFVSIWAYVDDPVLGSSCYPIGESVSASVVQRLLVVGGISGIASAAIALIITLFTTVRQLRLAVSLRLPTTLSKVLLRDGSLFFLLQLLYNILSFIPATNGIVVFGSIGSILDQVLPILRSILLPRFLINLRQAATPSSIPSDNRHPSQVSVPNFRTLTLDEVMDNLGEPMEFVEYRVEEDEEGQEVGGSGAQYERKEDTMQSENAAGPSGTTHYADVEGGGPARSNNRGDGDADVGVLNTTSFRVGGQDELRLSPTLTV